MLTIKLNKDVDDRQERRISGENLPHVVSIREGGFPSNFQTGHIFKSKIHFKSKNDFESKIDFESQRTNYLPYISKMGEIFAINI